VVTVLRDEEVEPAARPNPQRVELVATPVVAMHGDVEAVRTGAVDAHALQALRARRREPRRQRNRELERAHRGGGLDPDRQDDVFDEPELATAVRAANAVATAYLAHRDRVGLVSFGGLMRWLRPGMGARQQYVIVDMLLGTSVFDSVAWRDIDAVPPKALPPKALVIALSPLLDRRAIGAIIDLRRRGIDVVVVEVSPLPFAPAMPGVNGEVAHRLWQLQRALVRDRFAELGVPVVVWDPRRALAVTIEEIAVWPTARRLVR